MTCAWYHRNVLLGFLVDRLGFYAAHGVIPQRNQRPSLAPEDGRRVNVEDTPKRDPAWPALALERVPVFEISLGRSEVRSSIRVRLRRMLKEL